MSKIDNWLSQAMKPGTTAGGIVSSIGSSIGTTANSFLGNGMVDNTAGKVGSGISTIGNAAGQIASIIPGIGPLIGGAISAASGLIGGAVTGLWGADFNEEAIAEIEKDNARLLATNIEGSSNQDILSQWSSQDFGKTFSKDDIGEEGVFSTDVTDKYNELQGIQDKGKNRILSSYDNAISNIEKTRTQNILANNFARGGAIHIAPSKRGTFTAAATKHNMGVQEFARKVLANKDEYSTAMVKKANFAKNASGWKHSDGGFLTHGGVFGNGITIINNGNSHEENPNEGVQIGVDPQGIPNLVEENEVVWNNYVFSDRLKATKSMKKKYSMRSNKDMSFADVAKKMAKESEERPNDPISKRGLEANLMQLAMEQEALKTKKGKNKTGNKFYTGGPYETFNIDAYKAPTLIRKEIDTSDIDSIDFDNFVLPEQVEITNPKFAGFGTTEYDSRVHKDMMRDWDKDKSPFASYLRYTPLIGNITGIAQNLLSKPDYSAADRLNKAAADLSTAPRIGYTPLGDYMSYTPVDTNVLTNKLAAESAGLRNTLLNSSSPSRTAALLAADYNAQNALGDAYLKAAEQNLARKQAAATFNRGTNQANAEMGLKASMANAELAQKAKQLGLSATLSAIQARDAVDAARNAALNTNINQFFTGLGNIGKEQQIMKLLSTGKYGYDENGDLIYLGGK